MAINYKFDWFPSFPSFPSCPSISPVPCFPEFFISFFIFHFSNPANLSIKSLKSQSTNSDNARLLKWNHNNTHSNLSNKNQKRLKFETWSPPNCITFLSKNQPVPPTPSSEKTPSKFRLRFTLGKLTLPSTHGSIRGSTSDSTCFNTRKLSRAATRVSSDNRICSRQRCMQKPRYYHRFDFPHPH